MDETSNAKIEEIKHNKLAWKHPKQIKTRLLAPQTYSTPVALIVFIICARFIFAPSTDGSALGAGGAKLLRHTRAVPTSKTSALASPREAQRSDPSALSTVPSPCHLS